MTSKVTKNYVVPLAIIAFSSLLLSACNNHAGGLPIDGGNSVNKHRFQLTPQVGADDRSTIHLGDGIDTRTNFTTHQNCFSNKKDPNNITMSDPVGSAGFDSTMSTSDIATKVGFEFSGKGDFVWASAELPAKYLKDSSNTRQSLHFNYLQLMSATAEYQIPDADGTDLLEPYAKKYMETGNLESFFNKCGDGFVRAADVGAVLMADLSFDFSSHDAAQDFAAKVDVKAGPWQVMAAFENYQKEHKTDASVHFRTLQLGGNVKGLADIFGNQDYNHNYNITYCSAGDLGHCKQVINDVVYYAQHGFKDGINFKDMSTLYTFNHSDMLYSKLNIKAKLPPLSPAEQAAKNYIVNTIKHDKQMLEYLTAYSKQPIYKILSANQYILAKFQGAVSEYTHLLDDFTQHDIVGACYGNPNDIEVECLRSAQYVKEQQDSYKTDLDFADNLANAILIQPDDTSYEASKLLPYSEDNKCYEVNGKIGCDGNYSTIDTSSLNREETNYSEGIAHCKRIVQNSSYRVYTVNNNFIVSHNVYFNDTCDDPHWHGDLYQGTALSGTGADPEDLEMKVEMAHYENDPNARYDRNFVHHTKIHFYYSDSSDFRYNPI